MKLSLKTISTALSLVTALVVSAFPVYAEELTDSYVNFNDSWRFARFGLQPDGSRVAEPVPAPVGADFDDSSWRKLDVPHDWGIEGPFRIELNGNTGKLPWSGIGWYRKAFDVPASAAGRQVYLDFDGAMAYAQIWLNGQYVGTWPYGYSSFRMDLTPFIKPGEKNVVAVRLDTEKWDSRWYPGAGIYRNVYLTYKNPIHVGHWGTFITTPTADADSAAVNLQLTVENHSDAKAEITAKTELFLLDKSGKPGESVGAFSPQNITVDAKGEATIKLSATVNNPALWSMETPQLYVALTRLYQGETLLDSYKTEFGIRTISWNRQGFYLNGKRIQIKGVCQHHDLGALGAAVNYRALQRQLEILQSMGVNSIRTSHNPPAPELLELCDKMGLIVMDEAFDCWARGKRNKDYNKLYAQWHEKDMTAMVKRDWNHPCVVMWSIGNEVMEQGNREIHKHLVSIIKNLDTSRAVTCGYNSPDVGRKSDACLELDVIGVNYRFAYQKPWDSNPKYKDFPHVGSETASCLSTRGEYFFADQFPEGTKNIHRQGWFSDSYDIDRPGWGCTPDRQFEWLDKDFPYFWGEYVWTGFDYLGEPTPFNSDHTNLLNFRDDPVKWAQAEKEIKELEKTASPARSSYFGILDLAGFRKDRFYIYQAQWLPDKPMAHILPHWNWSDRVGKKVPIHVYTSGDTAELFINGVSQGVKTRVKNKDYRLVWEDAIYQPGTVKVVVTKDGKPWAEDSVSTTDSPAKLDLLPDRNVLNAQDKNDLSFITLRVTDKNGLTVPQADNFIQFSIEGEGEIVAVDNGSPISFEPFQASTRKAFNGLALVIVKAKPAQPGKPVSFKVKAQSEGLTAAEVQIESR